MVKRASSEMGRKPPSTRPVCTLGGVRGTPVGKPLTGYLLDCALNGKYNEDLAYCLNNRLIL
ncbi:MAG: hypothetical protein R3E32_06550 [Chitinophagales bacterium]